MSLGGRLPLQSYADDSADVRLGERTSARDMAARMTRLYDDARMGRLVGRPVSAASADARPTAERMIALYDELRAAPRAGAAG